MRSASAPPDRLCLVAMTSPIESASGTILEVGDAPTVISRVTDPNDVDECDDWMSREHATARLLRSRVVLRDGAAASDGWRSSANGTFVVTPGSGIDPAEVPSDGEIALEAGQVVRTGRTLWMLVVNPAPSPPDSLLVGSSDALGQVRDELKLLAAEVMLRFERRKRVTQSLLVTGPRGSGKQVVANELHRLLVAQRGAGVPVPFVDIHAPALADGTGAADIFGVVDRYATDVKARPGYFERAHGGVVFIDEVADLPLAEQAKFLNLLEERRVTRLGGRAPFEFDCLVVAATNKDITKLTRDGGFRPDLLDRLGRFHIDLAPLAARPEDILPLARTLLSRHAYPEPLDWEVALALLDHPWPGSVRDLDAFIERLVAVVRASGDRRIDLAHVQRAMRASRSARSPGTGAAASDGAGSASNPKGSGVPERDELLRHLVDSGWNKSAVARTYGKHPRQITRWMQYLDIERP